jgi:preprotein translocase subunit SecA
LELTQKQFTSAIIRAQKQMEGRHFGTRKHLFDYDSVIDKQRQTVYRKRDDILLSEHDESLQLAFIETTKADIFHHLGDIIQRKVIEAQTLDQPLESFLEVMNKDFSLRKDVNLHTQCIAAGYQHVATHLEAAITTQLQEKFASIDAHKLYMIFRDVYLYHIDTLWVKHLDEMEELRDKVGLM